MRMSLHDLEKRIDERSRNNGDGSDSYTAQLLSQGIEKCAKKAGEEAVELGLAAMSGKRPDIVGEAADTLYHVLVLLKACDIPLAEIEYELALRDAQNSASHKANVRGT